MQRHFRVWLHSQRKSGNTSKRKYGNKGKKRISKQKLLKGCHQGQNVTVLTILERLEFKKFSCRPILSSVSWPLHFEIPFTVPVMSLLLSRFLKMRREGEGVGVVGVVGSF